MTEDDIPDGVPDEGVFNPQPNPHAVPANHAGAMQVQLGLDKKNGLIIIRIGSGEDQVGTAIPIAGALQLIHNILGKCNEALMGPPLQQGEDHQQGEDQGRLGIILPGD